MHTAVGCHLTIRDRGPLPDRVPTTRSATIGKRSAGTEASGLTKEREDEVG